MTLRDRQDQHLPLRAPQGDDLRAVVELHVSASAENEAFSALVFLNQELLDHHLDLKGDPALVVALLYGSGLRLMAKLR